MTDQTDFIDSPPACLLIFARYPEIGKVKTRLIPDLGVEAATSIYKQMAEFTIGQARALRLQRNIGIQVWFTGGTEAEMQAWLGEDLDYHVQVGENLGDRLIYSLKTAIQPENHTNTHANPAVIIGTDCPELSTQILDQAFAQLQHHDLVLGAAIDGGYYLIGLQKFMPQLFTDIPWSTDRVLAKTLEISQKMGLDEFMLPTLSDVDTVVDLPVWEKVKANLIKDNIGHNPKISPKISVIIPTFNEAENLLNTLQSVLNGENIEIIVIDGGSTDQTLAIAQSITQSITQSMPVTVMAGVGRAQQMNLGAKLATGEILLFLHADTILSANYDRSIRKILTETNVAGAFKLAINNKSWGLRLVTWGVNRRSQLLQMPYGDQAIFMKSSQFHSLGGFADLPIMEDFELMLRLRKQGKIAIAPLSVTTSARRWQKLGIFRTTLINQIMIIGYFLGIKPTKLANWYRSYKGKN